MPCRLWGPLVAGRQCSCVLCRILKQLCWFVGSKKLPCQLSNLAFGLYSVWHASSGYGSFAWNNQHPQCTKYLTLCLFWFLCLVAWWLTQFCVLQLYCLVRRGQMVPLSLKQSRGANGIFRLQPESTICVIIVTALFYNFPSCLISNHKRPKSCLGLLINCVEVSTGIPFFFKEVAFQAPVRGYVFSV